MSAQTWRVFTHAKSPDAPTWLVASTLWGDGGPQPNSYTVLREVDSREEAQATAEECQREYDQVRRLFVGATP